MCEKDTINFLNSNPITNLSATNSITCGNVQLPNTLGSIGQVMAVGPISSKNSPLIWVSAGSGGGLSAIVNTDDNLNISTTGGIATVNFSDNIDIQNLTIGTYSMPSTSGTNGYILKTNGTNSASWQPNAGGGSINSVNSGSNITVNNTDPDNPIVNLDSSISGLSGVSTSALTIGPYTMPTTAGTANYYLKTNGTSAASWQPVAGSGMVDSVNSGTNITVNNTDPLNPVVNLDSTISVSNLSTTTSMTIGPYTMPNTAGVNGYSLVTNGSNAASWQDISGSVSSINKNIVYCNIGTDDLNTQISGAISGSATTSSPWAVSISAGTFTESGHVFLILGASNGITLQGVVQNQISTILSGNLDIGLLSGSQNVVINNVYVQSPLSAPSNGSISSQATGVNTFNNVSWDSTLTIDNFSGTAGYYEFNDCFLGTEIIVNSTFTGTIYFNNCNFSDVTTYTLNQASSNQIMLKNCEGLPTNIASKNLILQGLGITTSEINLASNISFPNTSVSIGTGALESITSGHGNTVIGDGSGTSMTSGVGNTLVGQGVSTDLTTGSHNTFIGNTITGTITGSNNTLIGYETSLASSSTSDAFILGSGTASSYGSLDFNDTENYGFTFQTNIGTTYSYTLPRGNGTNGQSIVWQPSGSLLSWGYPIPFVYDTGVITSELAFLNGTAVTNMDIRVTRCGRQSTIFMNPLFNITNDEGSSVSSVFSSTDDILNTSTYPWIQPFGQTGLDQYLFLGKIHINDSTAGNTFYLASVYLVTTQITPYFIYQINIILETTLLASNVPATFINGHEYQICNNMFSTGSSTSTTGPSILNFTYLGQ